eukprot:Skav211804  [mRNA]  locus=scaffold305:438761:439387:- [translate_table: standard]
MVEIRPHVLEAFALLFKQIALWSKVMYVVPDDQAPEHFILRVSSPSMPFSTSSKLLPPTPGLPARHATVKWSAQMLLLIHVFSIQDVVVTLQLGSALQICNIAACFWLSDCQATHLLSRDILSCMMMGQSTSQAMANPCPMQGPPAFQPPDTSSPFSSHRARCP